MNPKFIPSSHPPCVNHYYHRRCKSIIIITMWFDCKNEGETRVNRFTRVSQLGQLIIFSEKTVAFYICAREAGSARE